MRPLLLVALGAICAACAAGDADRPDLGDTPYISVNSLPPEALTDSGDALAALAGGALPGTTTDLVDTEYGQKLLSYVVRCALAEGETASFPRPGDTDLMYDGLLGFAPDWMSGAIDVTAQRLMTGCLMAHVNAFHIQVPISVRTRSRGAASLEERKAFPAQELTAYGNFFGADPATRELHVCFGEAVARSLGFGGGVGGGRPTYLDLRICSTSGACGFNRVGACFRWPEMPDVVTSACERRSDSFYSSCHERPIEQVNTPAWQETVSVYLQQEDLEQMVDEYRKQACTGPGDDGGPPGPPGPPLDGAPIPTTGCDIIVEN
jgi:hypothetical protein